MYIRFGFVRVLSRIVFCNLLAVLILSLPATGAQSAWQALIADGDRYIEQQKLVQAEDCYRRALKEVGHTKYTNDDKVKCIEKLAASLVMQNKIEEATHLYYRSLHILEDNYGKNSSRIVSTLFALGSIFESEGDHRSAMKLYKRAVAINERNYGSRSTALAESLHRLGHANASAGQISEAERNYKASLAILMDEPSLSSSKQLENLLSDYNDLLRKNDNTDSALISDFQREILKDRHEFPVPAGGVPPSEWQKQMAAKSRMDGEWRNNEEQQILLRGFKQPLSSDTLKPAYKAMSDVLHNQHPYAQGEEYYKRMIALDVKTLGESHPSVADDLTGLSLLYISQHRYSEAKPLLERAMAIYQSVYGTDNLLVVRSRDYLALVYDKLGETQKAAALYDEILHANHMILDPNNLETARLLNELAYMYFSQGKLEDACTTYAWAVESTKAAVGEQNILVAACLTDYAHALRSAGRIAEANQMEDQARIILRIHLDDKGIKESYHG